MTEEEKKVEDEKAQKEAEEKAKADAEAKAKAAKNSDDGKSEYIKKSEAAAADIKAENEKKEKLLEREEKLQDRKEALNALGGGSPAGTKTEKKEETPKEYNDRIEKEIADGKHVD